jgi:hypothetical protein
MSVESEGFLARWSRRKAQTPVERAREEIEPPVRAPIEPPASAAAAPQAEPVAPAPPPPTLADVAALTRESDFSRFVVPGVDEGVKHAALKKLFSDPHFNVMDGLDTYIDDYNKADPLPLAMLRKMTQSVALGLASAPEGEPEPGPPPDGAKDLGSGPSLTEKDDENPDLQLQPDDADRRPGAEPRAAGDGRESAGPDPA